MKENKSKEIEKKIKEFIRRVRKLMRLVKIVNLYAEELNGEYNFAVAVEMSIQIHEGSKIIDVYYYPKTVKKLKCDSPVAIEILKKRLIGDEEAEKKYGDIRKLIEKLIKEGMIE